MWREENNQLVREFRFADFNEAFAFMKMVAAAAEEMDHHPWWSNEYDKVTIKLTTHSAGGKVTEKDRQLAETIDKLRSEFKDRK